MLGELLGGDDRYAPPSLAGRALMHGHCHQKSVLSLEDDAKLCARAGLDGHVLDSGAAEWPAHSASKPESTPSRFSAASGSSCRPYAPRIPKPS
jgi:hypothetical protein